MFGSGSIFASGVGGNPILLDRVTNNQTYTEYEEFSCTHTDEWATAFIRHKFTMGTNFSGPYWCALTYDLPALDLTLTDYTDVTVRAFTGTAGTNAELILYAGLSTSATAEPTSGNRTSIVQINSGQSISFIYRTVALDSLTNYGTAGYDHLWVGYTYGMEVFGKTPENMDAFIYDIEVQP